MPSPCSAIKHWKHNGSSPLDAPSSPNAPISFHMSTPVGKVLLRSTSSAIAGLIVAAAQSCMGRMGWVRGSRLHAAGGSYAHAQARAHARAC